MDACITRIIKDIKMNHKVVFLLSLSLSLWNSAPSIFLYIPKVSELGSHLICWYSIPFTKYHQHHQCHHQSHIPTHYQDSVITITVTSKQIILVTKNTRHCEHC